MSVMNKFRRISNRQGQSATEYILILVVAAVIIYALKDTLVTKFKEFAGKQMDKVVNTDISSKPQ